MDILQVAQQTQAATYVTWCALVIFTWDWILALAEEYEIVKRCGRNCTVLVYFLARISAGVLCVLVLIYYLGALRDDSCLTVFAAIGAMLAVGSAAKSCLFLLRVRAVYRNSKLVTVLAGIGWLAVVCTWPMVAHLVHTYYVGPIEYCTVSGFASITVLSLWLNLAYDTCIYVAISTRLIRDTKPAIKSRISVLIRGSGLPRTMRYLLRDGHIYYFTTIFFTLLACIISVMPQFGPIFRTSFTVPAFVIETIMACKVFRAVILRSDHTVAVAPTETSTLELTILERQTHPVDTVRDQA